MRLREDMLNLARRNIELAGLLDRVQLIQRDISQGFTETGVDALFLDVREPQDYIPQALDALGDGGFFGAWFPPQTRCQISWGRCPAILLPRSRCSRY